MAAPIAIGTSATTFANGDQHLTKTGQTILADAMEAALIAQGWT